MAIVLPVLLLLVFGIIEMSNAWRTFQVVTNAAREGARVAILDDSAPWMTSAPVSRDHLEGRWSFRRPGHNILVSALATRRTARSANRVKMFELRVTRPGFGSRYPFTFKVLGRLADWCPSPSQHLHHEKRMRGSHA
jgi:hypothetical protein